MEKGENKSIQRVKPPPSTPFLRFREHVILRSHETNKKKTVGRHGDGSITPLSLLIHQKKKRWLPILSLYLFLVSLDAFDEREREWNGKMMEKNMGETWGEIRTSTHSYLVSKGSTSRSSEMVSDGNRVILEVTKGTEAERKRRKEGYLLAKEALRRMGPSYGWDVDRNPETLSEEEQDILRQGWERHMKPKDGSMEMNFEAPMSDVLGTLEIELHVEEAPRACENFRCLSTGEKGKGKGSGKALHYSGCRFFRIEKGFLCQTGDFVRNDGSGGESIYGKKFPDEKGGLKLKHDVAGVVGMANSGKNTNTSQFYITFGPCPKLDGKHVIFGRMTKGFDVLEIIESAGGSDDGTPLETFCIAGGRVA